MTDRNSIPDTEVRYIYRKLGNLEAQVEATRKGSAEVRAHSIETRTMLQTHIQEVRHSNAVNDQRWETIEHQLDILTTLQEFQKVVSKIGSFVTGLVGFMKSLAIIAGVCGVVYFALKSGDLGTALTAVKVLVGLE